MNKICTTVEQSKKLLELGIDVNTADMYYQYYKSFSQSEGITEGHCDIPVIGSWKVHHISIPDPAMPNADIPAWSLSALLKFIKSEIYGETIYGDTITYKVDFHKYKLTDDVDLYQIAYGSIKFDVDGRHSFTDMVNTGQKEDPIDAAFQMVCWLLESHYI